MKKKGTVILVALIIVLLGLATFKAIEIYKYSSTHFSKNTFISDVNCSGLTVAQAEKKLTDEWQKNEFKITKNGRVIGNIDNMNLQYDIKSELQNLLTSSFFEPFKNYFNNNEKHLNINMKLKDSTWETTLGEKIEKLGFLESEYQVKTRDAYIDKSNTNFKIVKEVYGDNLDKKRFKEAIVEKIYKNKWTLEYNPKDYYELPKIKSGSQSIKNELEYCKKYLTQKITYQLYNREETLTPSEIDKMIKVDNEGKVQIKNQAVEQQTQSLAYRFNTVGGTFYLKGSGGKSISVSGGSYGYILSKSGEAKKLSKDLQSKKDVKREPIYSQTPYARGSNQIGDSYIEINISSQMVSLYKNGYQVLSTPAVTGNVKKGKGTPTGVYGISYLDRNATLRGPDYDGKEYESKVKYWMPFNGGIGLHDADWRKKFGGKIYISDGSHGCVNLPESAAANIFSSITSGFPVVVHY